MAFCTNCGQQVADGAKFCANCGTPVSQNVANTERKTVFDGEIHKCPHCGEVLKAFETVCPTCKFEIRGAKGSNAVKDLAEKLENASSEKQRIIIIKNFPIPNTKEDIFEFMLLASSNFDAFYYTTHLHVEDVSDAWLSKIEQCYSKAKILLDDKDIVVIKNVYDEINTKIYHTEQALTKQEHRRRIKKASVIISSILLPILLAISIYLLVLNYQGAFNKDPNAIKIGFSERDAIGESYVEVVELLKTKGFTNIEIIDDGYNKYYNPGDITGIKISELNGFYDITKVNKDAKILIYYCSDPQLLEIGFDHDDLIGQEYSYVLELLSDKGFSDVQSQEDGWNLFHKSKTVKKILVNGEEGFSKEDKFYENANIVILYYK